MLQADQRKQAGALSESGEDTQTTTIKAFYRKSNKFERKRAIEWANSLLVIAFSAWRFIRSLN